MSLVNLRERIRGRRRRYLAEHLIKRRSVMNNSVPFISFTFDDFPRSALIEGGAILRANGLRGTYYASLGFLGERRIVGEMFKQDDIECLLSQGHELGCHTAEHLNPWAATPRQFEDSILHNRQLLQGLIPGFAFRSFSYPLAYPNPRIKKRVSKYFSCCRGGGQKNNQRLADLNLLNAYFLEFSAGNPTPVKAVIDRNTRVNGWLIFATHDISDQHSPHGCTPAFFSEIVRYSAVSGARILPVIQAYEAIFSRKLTSGVS